MRSGLAYYAVEFLLLLFLLEDLADCLGGEGLQPALKDQREFLLRA